MLINWIAPNCVCACEYAPTSVYVFFFVLALQKFPWEFSYHRNLLVSIACSDCISVHLIVIWNYILTVLIRIFQRLEKEYRGVFVKLSGTTDIIKRDENEWIFDKR